MARILGIDPGLNITGYAVIESDARQVKVLEAGVVRSTEGRKTADMAERLSNLYDGIVEIIEQYQPESICVEQLYSHYDHPRTAILMAHARGVIFLAGGQKSIPVSSYAATQIKKTITGHGRASKEQMQYAMLRECQLSEMPEPPDVADALAVSLCHHFTGRIGLEV